MKSDADRTFPSRDGEGSSPLLDGRFEDEADGAFDAKVAREAANDAEVLPGLRPGRVHDLVVCGGGLEEAVSYHLYLGSTLSTAGTRLVVRFATRTILVEGERLGPFRDALVARRLERLRITPRSGLIHAQHDQRPVITRISVRTPRGAEVTLDAELEEAQAPAPATP